jgi:hypothetical protein
MKSAAGVGTILLADGRFHSELAVGHAELREAIRAGWEIWGMSSIGAIRAAEMRTLGMKGFGDVYQRFVEDADFSDDEVALLHSPEAPYEYHSEPLIHLRLFVQDLVTKNVVTDEECHTILKRLKGRWFGFRTITALRQLLIEHSALEANDIAWHLKGLSQFRVKSKDLSDFLKAYFHNTAVARSFDVDAFVSNDSVLRPPVQGVKTY